jgi:hypothetical protein
MKLNLISLGLFIFTLGWAYLLTSNFAFADERVKEKSKEAVQDTKRAGNKAVRVIDDKVCSLVSGKMECAVKKVKHTSEKVGHDIEDAVD